MQTGIRIKSKDIQGLLCILLLAKLILTENNQQ